MKTLISNENSISLGKVTLEPFKVVKANIITIDWPLHSGSVEEDKLINILCEGRSTEGIKVLKKAKKATPLSKKILKLKNLKIPHRDELASLMDEKTKERFNRNIQNPVFHLPQTFRILIALHLACIESSFVLYESAGLDPMGANTIIDYCRKKTNLGWSFICLRHPFIDQIDSDNQTPVARIYSEDS